MDILCKPLSGNRFALSFINVSQSDKADKLSIKLCDLKKYLGDWIFKADKYLVKDIFTGEVTENVAGVFEVNGLKACDNATFLITPKL